MGESSPEKIELACPSCDTEFSREVSDERGFTVPCPECGKETPVKIETAPLSDDAESDGDDDQSDDSDDRRKSKSTLLGVGVRAPSSGYDEESEGESLDPSGTIHGKPLGSILDNPPKSSKKKKKKEQKGESDETDGSDEESNPFSRNVHSRETAVNGKSLNDISDSRIEEHERAKEKKEKKEQSLSERLQKAREKWESRQETSKQNKAPEDTPDENDITNVPGTGGLSEATQVASEEELEDEFGTPSVPMDAVESVAVEEGTASDDADEANMSESAKLDPVSSVKEGDIPDDTDLVPPDSSPEDTDESAFDLPSPELDDSEDDSSGNEARPQDDGSDDAEEPVDESAESDESADELPLETEEASEDDDDSKRLGAGKSAEELFEVPPPMPGDVEKKKDDEDAQSEPTVGKQEQPTPSVGKQEQPTPSVGKQEQPTPSVGKQEQPTPSVDVAAAAESDAWDKALAMGTGQDSEGEEDAPDEPPPLEPANATEDEEEATSAGESQGTAPSEDDEDAKAGPDDSDEAARPEAGGTEDTSGSSDPTDPGDRPPPSAASFFDDEDGSDDEDRPRASEEPAVSTPPDKGKPADIADGAPSTSTGSDDAEEKPNRTPSGDTAVIAGSDIPETPAADDDGGDGMSTGALLGALAFVVVAGGAAAYALLMPGGSDTKENGGEQAEADEEKEDRSAEIGKAVTAASSTIVEATDVDVSDDSLRERVASRLLEEGDAHAASKIWDARWNQHRQDAAFAEKYVDLLLKAKRHYRARKIAVEAMQFAEQPEVFRKKFAKALRDDKALTSYEVVELDQRSGLETLAWTGHEDFRGLEIRGSSGSPTHLFVPSSGDTAEKRSRWREQVAAWRLCQAAICPFDIPRTEPARISRTKFESLAESTDPPEGLTNGALGFVEAKGPDGETREYLYGALKRWPGEVVRWPIESYDVWRPWVWQYGEKKLLDKPLQKAIAGFKELDGGSYYENVLREMPDGSVRQLARQLSGILVFDYLTNNWGRFSSDEANYGSNNHFADGRFITVRMDTVFQRRSSTRVQGRFKWATRFSRDMITALGLLDRDTLSDILFPDRRTSEGRKLDVFWDQHERVLKRVDKLADKHGRDDVLFFE